MFYTSKIEFASNLLVVKEKRKKKNYKILII